MKKKKRQAALRAKPRIKKVGSPFNHLIEKMSQYLKSGAWDQAEELCRQMERSVGVQTVTQIARARILVGRGEHEAAIALLMRLAQEHPGDAGIVSDMAYAHSISGKHDQAVEAYKELVKLSPTNSSSYCKMLDAMIAAHKWSEVIQVADRCRELFLDSIFESFAVKGLRGCERFAEAAERVEALLIAGEKQNEWYRVLASIWRDAGDNDRFHECIERWLAYSPHHPVALHLRHAFISENRDERSGTERASDAYVTQVFDQYASTFEQSLTSLEYRGPDQLQQEMRRLFGEGKRALRILDAGCGTGLCGQIVRPYARSLIGIDLSGGMLDVANGKQIYDELLAVEISKYLKDSAQLDRPPFDLIVAIDAFNYFGELHSLLQTARNALEHDGRLIFTLEVGPADLPNGFSLELTGRYSHSVEYVLEWIVSAGFVVEKDLRFSIRQQSGKDVSASLLTLMPN